MKNLTTSQIESIFNDAMRIRTKCSPEQAKLFIVGFYASHTENKCILRQYWANMRDIINNGVFSYGDYVRFRNYYEISCNTICYLFGRFAWYNTLS